MRIHPTALPGVVMVTIEPHADQRGVFARTFDAGIFEAAGLPTIWPQCNISWNRDRGTLRGMHFQYPPHGEPKLVRCTRGRVFDVAVDLRPNSPTYCHWFGVELAHQKRNALFIPEGCAHGFLTLEDDSEVFYMMGDVFAPELASGVRWNDPAFSINWPLEPMMISERDAGWPDFAPCPGC
jgi:dTDP-4-dehydrorhamnose 3,5-epimerase